jgi:hypothetical protein
MSLFKYFTGIVSSLIFLLTIGSGIGLAGENTLDFEFKVNYGEKIYQADQGKEINTLILDHDDVFNKKDIITLTLSEGAFWYMDESDVDSLNLEGLELTDISDEQKTLTFRVTKNGYGELKFKGLLVATSIDAPLGNIYVNVGGDYSGTVLAGEIIPCADIEAEVISVAPGKNDQAAGDITLRERYKNSLEPVDNPGISKDGNYYLALSLPDGVSFSASPSLFINDVLVEAEFYRECFPDNTKNIFSGAARLRAGDPVCYIKVPDKYMSKERADSIRISNLRYQVAGSYDALNITVNIAGDMVNKLKGAGDDLVPGLESNNGSQPVFKVINASTDKIDPVQGQMIIGSKRMYVNNRELIMDTYPYIKDNRTYLPLRYAAYALGIKDEDISWDAQTNTAVLRRGPIEVTLQVGNKTIIVNGQSKEMDVVPEIKEDRITLPIKYVAEAFRGTVEWEPRTRTVTIKVL